MISLPEAEMSAHHAEGEVEVQGRVRRAGRLGESGYCLGRQWGRGRAEREGPTAGAGLTACTPNDASVTWHRGLTLVRTPSGATISSRARMTGVQHGSTATHPDAGGLAGTREDGDLRVWTRVDVLPPDGMQEVSGSSPQRP
jgi:hypothetical protein